MNRPRQVLMEAFLHDSTPFVQTLRARGWPVEVTAINEGEGAGNFYGLRIEVNLGSLPVPVESVGEGE